MLLTLFLVSCQSAVTFICPDGTKVSDSSLCPKKVSFCGDGDCDYNEKCGSCISDCGKCRLREADVNVRLEWEVSGMIEGRDWQKCGDYNAGDVYGFITLADGIEGSYICKSSIGNEREAEWRISNYQKVEQGFFAMTKPLKELQSGEICCYSDSPTPDFCEPLLLPAYC